jgi:peptidyl-prolyl cis-trans isomerase B (cyclophilin B)
MGIMRKVTAVALSISLLTAGLVTATPAEAAVGCTSSKAKGFTPKSPGMPSEVLKSFPKKFTLKTNCGNIEITPLSSSAPMTVTSFAFLASKKYFDKTICHRLTTSGIFVLQCGDPSGTGGGDSFYTFPDENLPPNAENNYPAGTVAMANRGPGTNSTQFFLVYRDTYLPPNYTIWGKISKGLDIVKFIAKQGLGPKQGNGDPAKPGDSMPKKTIEIISFR